jgi:hypothetical protein
VGRTGQNWPSAREREVLNYHKKYRARFETEPLPQQLKDGRGEQQQEESTTPRPVRLVVVFLFGPAILMATTFAFLLAFHMFLEPPGFPFHLFFVWLRPHFFRPLWLLQRNRHR